MKRFLTQKRQRLADLGLSRPRTTALPFIVSLAESKSTILGLASCFANAVTPRSTLIALVYAFFTLLVAFAVIMGGYLVATAVQDVQLALVLRIIGISCLLLLAIDGVLLVLALAVNAVASEERRDRPTRAAEPGDERRSVGNGPPDNPNDAV
jgi:hypothetical protein